MVLIESPFPPVPVWPTMNAYSFLVNHPLGQPAPLPDHTLYIDGVTGKKRTRNEFLHRVATASYGLTAPNPEGLGLKETDMVAVLSENCLDFIVLANALLSQAVPFALCSAHVTPFELHNSIRLSKANHLFCHANLLPVALHAVEDLGIPHERIYILEGNGPGEYRSLEDLVQTAIRRGVTSYPNKQVTKDTLAYLVFSSGTSGLPKAVGVSHHNVVFSVLQAYVWTGTLMRSSGAPPPLPAGKLPVQLAFLPMYHTYGLHAFVFRPLLTPTTIVIIPRWNLDLGLKLITKYRVSALLAVPSVVVQLANSPKTSHADLSSLTTIASGAAYLPPPVAAAFKSRVHASLDVSHGYGLSEATISAINLPRPKLFPAPFPQDELPFNTAGILIPGMTARIVREDGSDADYEEPGELWLGGENIALGYYGNEKATSETFFTGEDGRRWMKTGDLFKYRKDGFFWFEDRVKDTLKVSGMQVAPAEIENSLLNHPKHLIKDAAVAGITLPKTLLYPQDRQDKDHTALLEHDAKYPRAWVVLSKQGKKVGEEGVRKALEEWTQKTLSRYKWLRGGIQFVDEIPKSATGKVLRRTLVEQYDQEYRKVNAKL